MTHRRLFALGLTALLTLTLTCPTLLGDDEPQAEGPATEAPETPVSIFPDKKLEAVVRKQVYEKRNNDEPLTAADVEKISTITGKGQGVTDLTGLEHCLSLMQLDLEDSEISDLTPLKELTELQQITLAGNQIEDLTPLAGLKKLQYLQLSGNKVRDLSPLGELRKMQSLYLSKNQIEDLGPIAHMEKLWSLYIDGNQVADLTPVKGLRWLSSFDASHNQLEDVAALSQLTELRIVILEHNQLKTLGPIVDMVQKDVAGDRTFASFLKLYLTGNPLDSENARAQVELLKKHCREVQVSK